MRALLRIGVALAKLLAVTVLALLVFLTGTYFQVRGALPLIVNALPDAPCGVSKRKPCCARRQPPPLNRTLLRKSKLAGKGSTLMLASLESAPDPIVKVEVWKFTINASGTTL